MRPANRDKCRSALLAFCTALIILISAVPPAGALSADYLIFPNGTAYRASIDIGDTGRYEFTEIGIMGENVPVEVRNVQIMANGTPIAFSCSTNWGRPKEITFAKGNYTISYVAPLRNHYLQGFFEKPYSVNVTLPVEFSVQNRLLAGISSGADVTRSSDNTTLIRWNKSTSFELRFYDESQEQILFLFLQFMGILVLVLVVLPYLLSLKRPD